MVGLVLLVVLETEEGVFSAFESLASGYEAEVFAVYVDGKQRILIIHSLYYKAGELAGLPEYLPA